MKKKEDKIINLLVELYTTRVHLLIKEKPTNVIVFGDTDTTLAGTISLKKLNIHLTHIEAGLRSNDFSMPEEINRILTDRVSDLLIVPNKNSEKNLITEGVLSKKIKNFGDINFDILKIYKKKIKSDETNNLLEKYNITKKNFVYLTIHRKANISDMTLFNNILINLNKLNKKIIWPMHPNSKHLIKGIEKKIIKNFIIIKPLSFKKNLI